MKHVATLAIALGLAVTAPAYANLELAKKDNCLSCHAVDKKMVGPAFIDVSKKYAGDKEAAKKLAASIKGGSKGVWGAIPMPPNTKVSDADALSLAKWILAGAK